MRAAIEGLHRRGHAVVWIGGARTPAPPGIVTLGRVGEAARTGVDVVIASGTSLAAGAIAAWRTGAHALVLDGTDGPARPGPVRRWWITSLDSAFVAAAGATPGADGDAWPADAPPPTGAPSHPDVDHLERVCARLLARRRGPAPRPAAFLDRDGTLVVERGYLSDPEGLEILPGVPRALRLLRDGGYALVVVSNQSGIGRGMFTVDRVHEIMAGLRVLLRGRGLELDGIYFCPHRPDEGCACRKPGTALMERACAELNLEPRASAMIGDKLLDVETGQRCGARGLLVRTGYGRDEEKRIASVPKAPDAVVDDLAAAAEWMITRDAANGAGERLR